MGCRLPLRFCGKLCCRCPAGGLAAAAAAACCRLWRSKRFTTRMPAEQRACVCGLPGALPAALVRDEGFFWLSRLGRTRAAAFLFAAGRWRQNVARRRTRFFFCSFLVGLVFCSRTDAAAFTYPFSPVLCGAYAGVVPLLPLRTTRTRTSALLTVRAMPFVLTLERFASLLRVSVGKRRVAGRTAGRLGMDGFCLAARTDAVAASSAAMTGMVRTWTSRGSGINLTLERWKTPAPCARAGQPYRCASSSLSVLISS